MERRLLLVDDMALAQWPGLVHMKAMLLRLVTMLLIVLALGCGDSGSTIHSIYFVPKSVDTLADEAFLDHPFPSDFRRDPDGSVRLLGLHNPRNKPTVEEYVSATEGLLDGFSPAAAGYLRFDAAIDPASLPPTPKHALSAGSSVQLIDVDPDSPDHGIRTLVTTSFRAPGGNFVLPNTLRWMPTPGYPLRPATKYALVVTSALRSFDGGAVAPSPELRQVLGLDPASGPRVALRAEVAPALAVLQSKGIGSGDIAHLAVFTTGDPAAELIAIAKHLRAEVEAPAFVDPADMVYFVSGAYVEYQGEYGPSPNYQAGKLPFAQHGDGGSFNIVEGKPQVVDTFNARFSLTVPIESDCPMPEAGYPVVMYAHGTGGSWRSYIKSGYAKTIGRLCLAMMGVDQIFHGTRPGAPPPGQESSVQLLFFNFQNIEAARTNGRQSALDEVQRARLFTEARVTIAASISHHGKEIRFDPDRVMFFGHSQGGLNGPLYLAIDDSSLGGVLSGSGAMIGITLLEKTSPKPSIADLVRTLFLGLTPDEYDELDIFHPAISVAQALVDAIDPISYARYTVLEPLTGHVPKSILMTEGIGPDGIGDSYTPPRGTEAQAIAMGLPPQLPLQLPFVELSYGTLVPVEIPPEGLSGNLADGAASGVLAQWAPVPDSDGHFVVFDINEARTQVATFLRRLADDPVGNVPAPLP